MITGTVTADLDATITLLLLVPGGRRQEVEAVIDTGFDGFLTLPPPLIADLALQRLGRGRAMVADGGIDVFDIYAGRVLWDGVPRTVEVDAADIGVLVGMSLLRGHRLSIDVKHGGIARIERLP